jgi:serine/threonine protein kinase
MQRHEEAALVMENDWTGQELRDFVVEERLQEGSFSWVHKASRKGTNAKFVLKIGKSPQSIGGGAATGAFYTHAIQLISGSFTEAKPSPSALLATEFQTLEGWNDLCVVKAVANCSNESAPFIALEYINGKSMRELIGARVSPIPATQVSPISALSNLCTTLARLKEQGKFSHHGDIKPDNIMITGSEVKVIDPGYFGTLQTVGGGEAYCRVTTPAYYPTMQPDDLFAMGIILWEIVLGEQPFRLNGSFRAARAANAGPDLTEYVRQSESLGTYFLSPLADLPRPSEIIPTISEEKELLLLKGLRLTLTSDGSLELAEGFDDYAQLRQAIEAFR